MCVKEGIDGAWRVGAGGVRRRGTMMEQSDEVRVLLVEDDVALALMYQVKLERDGYTVRRAEDGEQALEALAGDLPDLIFLDVRMPRMDGLTFLERLRASVRTRDIPVVMLSNYSEPELVARGLRLGAREYLIKTQTTPGRLSAGVRAWSRPYEFSGGQEERSPA